MLQGCHSDPSGHPAFNEAKEGRVVQRLSTHDSGAAMTKLQRYLLSELLRVFFLMVVVLTVMLVFVGLLKERENQGLGFEQIIQIMPYVVPSMLPFTIPATLLLAVTVVYGRVAGDQEVIAAKAAGVNPLRLLTPAFLLGIAMAFGSFAMTNFATPWAIDNMERIVTQAIEDIFLDKLASQHYISEPEKGFSITVADVKERILVNATFTVRDDNHQQVTLNARYAKIRFDMDERKIKVSLRDVQANVPGRDLGLSWDEKELAFPLDMDARARNARHQTIDDIYQRLATESAEAKINQQQRDQHAAMLLLTGDFHRFGDATMEQYAVHPRTIVQSQRKLNTEIHSRYAMAASCFFFVLLGGPFAVYQARRQFITAFIMCFLPILLVYYPVTFLMVNLGKTGTIDPAWGMWVPNAILAVASLWVLRKVIQH